MLKADLTVSVFFFPCFFFSSFFFLLFQVHDVERLRCLPPGCRFGPDGPEDPSHRPERCDRRSVSGRFRRWWKDQTDRRDQTHHRSLSQFNTAFENRPPSTAAAGLGRVQRAHLLRPCSPSHPTSHRRPPTPRPRPPRHHDTTTTTTTNPRCQLVHACVSPNRIHRRRRAGQQSGTPNLQPRRHVSVQRFHGDERCGGVHRHGQSGWRPLRPSRRHRPFDHVLIARS